MLARPCGQLSGMRLLSGPTLGRKGRSACALTIWNVTAFDDIRKEEYSGIVIFVGNHIIADYDGLGPLGPKTEGRAMGAVKKTVARMPWPEEGRYSLNDHDAYCRWRDEKLASYPGRAEDLIVEVGSLSHPTEAECLAIRQRVKQANMAVYACMRADEKRGALYRPGVFALARKFGLTTLEAHRSRRADGLVPIEVAGKDDSARAGFIPYSAAALSWHTDGYYNGAHERIRAMVLHCARPGVEGGENELLDQEIAYIRLRDQNPDFIAALMADDAMTIPQAVEEDGGVRPASVGPVFWLDDEGELNMRYTARKRNIIWAADETTRAAAAALGQLLSGKSQDPLIIRLKLASCQGMICNNVLHNRSSFVDSTEPGQGRQLLRGRFFERIQ